MRCASPLRSKFYSGMLRTMKMLFGIGVVSILLINIPGSPECLAAAPVVVRRPISTPSSN